LAMRTSAVAWHERTQPIVTRHLLRSQRSESKRHLLLVEDNAVNQKVAGRILENLGYRIDTAVNGEAALNAWSKGRYDLILMDCQMPVMDGYEATRRIRSLEAPGSRIPIIALTAHAMKGADAECVAAGMDDYLTKPIDRAKLRACLARWLEEGDANSAEASARISTPYDEPVNWEQFLNATGNDLQFADELAQLFITTAQGTMDGIENALCDHDFATVAAKAHELKGASANLQASATMTAASLLEAAARNADVTNVGPLVAALREEIQRAIQFIRTRHAHRSVA
jgi:CheY-like chemotaxis protein